jgi:multicomponent Na+:H+ antiporter subunit D
MSIPFIAVPLILASIMPLIGKISKRFLPDLLTNTAFLFLLLYSVFAGRQTLLNGADVWKAWWFGEALNITLVLDGFSALMLLTISLIGLSVALYSINYMEHYEAKANFYALLLIMIAGMNGLVLSNDVFTLYLFLEVAAIASYGLIAFGLQRDQLEASLKYLLLSSVATAFILLSIAIVFGLTGSLQLDKIAEGISASNGLPVAGFCMALFIMGFGLKAAIVPFHAWLPDAHSSAPAPISAMLSGVLIKVSGIYALTRVCFTIFGMQGGLGQVLMLLGIVSILIGAIQALGQNDIKKMLAFSSISHIGYIILGLGVGTPLGILGAMFHLFNHAIAKGLLFLNSGALEQATGTRELDRMGGLARKMPITAGTSVVGSLAIAGVPPLNGFWSKLLILLALVEAKYYGLALIAALAGILTLWYYLIIQRRAFFGKLNETWNHITEAPFWMSFSVLLLATACVLIGLLFPAVILDWIKPAADTFAAGISQTIGLLGF